MSAQKFLMALFPQWTGNTFAEVRAFRNGTPQQHWLRSASDIIATANKLKPTHDVYIGVGARRGKNGGKEGVTYIGALWVDMDMPLPEARRRLDGFELPPSAVVASGHGAHAYWLLKEPYTIEGTDDRNYVEARLRGLAQALGADSAWDLCRILRVPDSINHKNGEELGVKLVRWAPDRRYNVSDFDLWAIERDTEAEPVTFSGTDLDAQAVLLKAVDVGISEETRRMIEEGYKPDSCKSRSERDQSVISRLILADLDDDEIRALFGAYAVGDKHRESGSNRYLARSIGRARARIEEPPDPVTGARSWEAAIAPEPGATSRPHDPTTYAGPVLPQAAWRHPFDLYREAVGSSTEAADEHHFAAFRAVVGAYFGRRVSVHYGRTQYPGDYVLLIGPTHDKKTTAQRRALDFLATLEPRVGTVASLHSAEGLIEWMAKLDMSPQELARFIDWMGNTKGDAWEPLDPENRRGLVSIEEFAALLQKARMEGSSQLITTITQLYDMPKVLEPPLRTRRIVAEAPTLSILAASTSQWIVQNLRSSDILGGFGNRFTYWTGLAKEPMPWPATADKNALRTVAAAVEEAFGRWQRGTEFNLTAGARTAWGAFYTRWVKQAREEGDSPTSAMESRIPEHAVKLALLYAALVNERPEIDEGQVDAAVQVAGYLRESTRFAFGDQLDTGESPTVKLENRILAVLDRESATKRELQQKSKQRRSSAIDFNRVYEGLVKARIIRESSETGKVEKL